MNIQVPIFIMFFLLNLKSFPIHGGGEKEKAFINAYPNHISEIKQNAVYFHDGTTMPFDDGRKKSHEEMLYSPDVRDMLFQPYPAGSPIKAPPQDFDPGRYRNEEFFGKIYGSNEKEVTANLVSVHWMPMAFEGGVSIQFNGQNGAAGALRKVSDGLDLLCAKRPEMKKYLAGVSTFNYRKVAVKPYLSAHSWGTAIDINVSNSNYWRWDLKIKGDVGEEGISEIPFKNKIPKEIVDIFEKHGFIAGCRWSHYDTMHFEYRPELNPPKKH